jgi:hypothetical protein
MLLLTNMLLLLVVAFMFGFSHRPWWQVGPLALLACGPLQFVQFLTGDWRHQVGLPYNEQSLDFQAIVWVAGSLLLCSYAGYAVGMLYSRWRGI